MFMPQTQRGLDKEVKYRQRKRERYKQEGDIRWYIQRQEKEWQFFWQLFL